MVGIYLTCDNHPENGKPRSLENAQTWREEDAKELIVIIIRPVNKPFKPSAELCPELNCLAPDLPDLN